MSPTFIAFLVAILVAVEILLIFFFLSRVASKSDAEREFEEQLTALTESELESDTKEELGFDPKSWTGFWYDMIIQTGRTPLKPEQPGQLALLLPLIGFGVGFLVWPRDILAGFAFGAGALALMFFYLRFEKKRRIKTLETQLSTLVDSLTASINANRTPQNALIESANEVPAPLGHELKALKTDLELNVPLSKALQAFAARIPSREIKFLVSAIEIAIDSGSDLAPQLDIIRETIRNRTRLQQKMASALSEATPALWVSGIVIPGALVFSFYSNDSNKDFWFSFYGLVALAGISVMYLVGLFITKKLVDGVEKV